MWIDAANHRPTITPITFDQSRPPNLCHCPTNRRSPFFKLKWILWGWGTGTVTVILGICLSYLAPTGRMTVISRVVEVTANVSGQITEISVPPNQLVKADAILFKIDPAVCPENLIRVDDVMESLKLAE
jgi:multidrug resistance efflux pump